MTGNSTYSGDTTAGTLQLGNGGTSGNIVGDVVDNGTLAFNRADTLVFPGIISGSGALAQRGTGSTVLTGASTYSGPTMVQSGTLIVNGSIRSSVTVLPGSTLAGSGTVGNVINQGVVWPGNPVAGDTQLDRTIKRALTRRKPRNGEGAISARHAQAHGRRQ